MYHHPAPSLVTSACSNVIFEPHFFLQQAQDISIPQQQSASATAPLCLPPQLRAQKLSVALIKVYNVCVLLGKQKARWPPVLWLQLILKVEKESTAFILFRECNYCSLQNQPMCYDDISKNVLNVIISVLRGESFSKFKFKWDLFSYLIHCFYYSIKISPVFIVRIILSISPTLPPLLLTLLWTWLCFQLDVVLLGLLFISLLGWIHCRFRIFLSLGLFTLSLATPEACGCSLARA